MQASQTAAFQTKNSSICKESDQSSGLEEELKDLVQDSDRMEPISVPEGEGEIEEDIIMRPGEYFIDKEKRIRLDKVLLGFEIDLVNDSITLEELKIREKR